MKKHLFSLIIRGLMALGWVSFLLLGLNVIFKSGQIIIALLIPPISVFLGIGLLVISYRYLGDKE